MDDKKINLQASLTKLNKIAAWFEEQREVDVEMGLEKVREGAALVKECRTRLAEIKNEFEHIQREVDAENTAKAPARAPAPKSRLAAVKANEEEADSFMAF